MVDEKFLTVAEEKFSTANVYEFQTDPATGVRTLIREHHYVRVRRGPDEAAVYLQDGRCWSETGELIPNPPKWVAEMLKTLTPATRAKIGWPEASSSA
jgi:hypothetical protein